MTQPITQPQSRKRNEGNPYDQGTVGIMEMFHFYKQLERSIPNHKKLHHSIYAKLVRDLLDTVLTDLIEEAIPLNMGPLGELVIEEGGIVGNSLRVNWGKTKSTGNLYYHFNEHTNYKYYRFNWLRSGHPFCKYFKFVIQSRKKHKLSKAIFENKFKRSGHQKRSHIQLREFPKKKYNNETESNNSD